MSNYTSGPWIFLPRENKEHAAIVSKKGWICDFIGTPSDGDVNLMIAAPDLLNALIYMRNFFISREEWKGTEARQIVDDAIYKAIGEL